MHENTEFSLSRDVEAIEIPSGRKLNLEKGTQGVITQTLGGSYTIATPYGLSRIAEKDLDALGLKKPKLEPKEKTAGKMNGAVSENDVWEQLKTCFDPEIPVNIVDLGLVYGMELTSLGDDTHKVDVKMTLTAQGCGMGATIAIDARQKLLSIPGIGEANVDIVWDPPWNPQMISPEGRERLGL